MRISVWHTAELPVQMGEGKWFAAEELLKDGLLGIPLTTVSRKSLDLLFSSEPR